MATAKEVLGKLVALYSHCENNNANLPYANQWQELANEAKSVLATLSVDHDKAKSAIVNLLTELEKQHSDFGGLNRGHIATKLGMDAGLTGRLLSELREDGLVLMAGEKRNSYWRLAH